MRKIALLVSALLLSSFAEANTITVTCTPAAGDIVTSCKVYRLRGPTPDTGVDLMVASSSTCKFTLLDMWNGTFKHYCTAINSIGEGSPSNVVSDTVGPKPLPKPSAPVATSTNVVP